MKKSVLTIMGIVGIVIILAFLFVPKEKLQEMQLSSSDTKTNKEDHKDIQFIAYGSTSNYRNGYFYIKHNDEGDNIMYFDYNTKKEVYLCNKPNCNHDDNTCSSYLKIGEENELFYYDDHLYLINAEASGNIVKMNFDGTPSEESEGRPSTIYRMNLDGTQKQQLFVVPSGTQMFMPYIIKGNIVYSFLEKYKMDKSENSTYASTVTERKLIAINLDTGKYEEIIDGLHKSFLGAYDNKLVIQEIEYEKDPNSFGNNTSLYVKNLYNSRTRIKLIDPETKNSETVYEGFFKDIEEIQFYKDGIYFIGQNSKKLEYMNFSTKKQETIKELSKTGFQISNIIDDKILVSSYKDKEALVGDVYYIDLKTKEMNEFSLKDKNEYLINILSSNDEFYFVQIEYEFGKEYTTWAGTKQKDIIGINYGLIKKSDYWASNPNYLKMTNAK